MPLITPRKLSKEVRAEYLDVLWDSIASLKSREEVKNFFKDLLSETESIMLARRIMIARMLLGGSSYGDIRDKLGASPTTVAGIHAWLMSGVGGYEKAIAEIRKITRKYENEKEYKEKDPFLESFDYLRRKYPLHFLLFNLFLDDKKKKK